MKNKHKNSIGYFIYRKKTRKLIEDKVNLLGSSYKYSAIDLLNLRFATCFFSFVISLFFLDYGYIIAPFIVLIMYYSFFPLFLDTQIKKREKRLEKDALDFFEILALSLEAGRNIKTALEVTTKNVNSSLSLEFARAVRDVNFGKDLDEALEELKYRIPSDTVNNIILNIRQANMFGNNIVDTIYNQINYIREKRVLDIKGEISKIPVKISIISVIFFIPLLLILLLGPLLISLL